MLNNKSSIQMSKSNCFNTPKLSLGMFSNQHSIISQLLSTKGKSQNQKHKVSKTTYEIQTLRADTPNSPNKSSPFKSKYHYNTLSLVSKMESNKNNIQQEKQKIKDNSADLRDLSIRLKLCEDDQINKILKSLKLIEQQMTHNQISQSHLQLWHNQLNQNCDKLMKILSLELNTSFNFYQPSTHIDTQLQKQLLEERKNRLLVEEQTSKIIQSQGQQITQYIDTIKLLEQKLLKST
ncbi:unnamed protein product (macronuclear) [Paramecium tetraurelia]|uniref:Uncharacterized protein n=1 Tax=Paramecium tetraurelia TaxID=5888 RepID=A0D9X8_PARTE|nr:uncharacterized protein GSPATT00014777001 [Paramecium tetraurelia]CAK79845.1 unnamed protein product [Paramecium tetraurelia]|eukprot:XP_001447242.1 hypothetical protein (macronuclear) [Paramecium tetraurelia strain d4-2]